MLIIIDSDSPGDIRALFNDSVTLSKRYRKIDILPSQLKGVFNGTTAYAGTVTIGNIRYGSLSDKEQYNSIVASIKKYFRYQGDDKYYFIFEHQKNGQLHAHYITTAYESTHREAFGHYGKRNSHKESFKLVTSIDSYVDYMFKEQDKYKYIFPHIHNIKKKDIRK